LTFTFERLRLKVGPLKLGPFKIGAGDKKAFFLFFYADDDIICAQGKGVHLSSARTELLARNVHLRLRSAEECCQTLQKSSPRGRRLCINSPPS
jgi:hypothetical protein